MSMLEFQHVGFRFPGDDDMIIRDLSFSVEAREFVSIIGASGCGKSTIFRLINQLIQKDEGEILINGQPISARKQYCGYMPQRDLLFPWRTVGDNVQLPLEVRGGISRAEMAEQVNTALAAVGLDGWADKRPAELSGGMRQRAAFARTMLTGSELLLLDEPFSALDFLTRISMQEWLMGQWEHEQKTILFITHDVEEALFLSNRIMVIEEKPITKLTSIPVPAGHPRTRACLADPQIIQLKEQLISMLRKQVQE